MDTNNTKVCKYCNETIAKNANRCPKCGGKFGMPGRVKVLIIIGIILFCIVGCINSCSNAVNEAINEVEDETRNAYNDKLVRKLD